MRKRPVFILYLLLFPYIFISPQPAPVMNSSELWLALKKLSVLGTVLYVAAHPDDENTAVLSYYSSGRLLRTGYLAVTRGDGGQNLLGDEKAELLGVLRTYELLGARKIDGAEQFFTRAVDFGYSKSPEETFSLWGKNEILGDVVRVIRYFRPDVIITRFPLNGGGGHGQHTASAVLASEAFDISGDSSAFPEQLNSLDTWKVKRLFWNKWIRPGESSEGLQIINTGAYNTLLGKSYSEIAALSRTMHKSQGFGSSGRRGESINYFELTKGDSLNEDIFDNIDISWNRVKGSGKIRDLLKEAEEIFNPEKPSAIIPVLLQAYEEMNRINENHWIPIKKKELLEVIRSAAGLWLEAVSAEYSLSPGDSLFINAGIVNRSDIPFILKKIEVEELKANHSLNKGLANGEFLTELFSLKLPDSSDYTQPYWLQDDPKKGIYIVGDQELIGKPVDDPPVNVIFTLAAGNAELKFPVPVCFRWTDPVGGEQYRPLEIIPPVTVHFEDKVSLFPSKESKEIYVKVRNNGKEFSGSLKLKGPAGWNIRPEEMNFSFNEKNEEGLFGFTVIPPAEDSEIYLTAEVWRGEKVFTRGMVSIQYPHIPPNSLFPEAEIKLIRTNLPKVAESIGYITGSGDEIPASLQDLGYKITFLSENDLENDLSQFDAIITGIRAFDTREFLKTRKGKLLGYVKNGGTLLVQYNTRDDAVAGTGPYDFSISRDRVAEEDAPVTILKPDHPLLNFPNKITPEDFNGWVQERGLYFPGTWASQYETIISANDTDEEPLQGGILFARYGKGIFIYTGYSWFRQLPAGVKGAYRIYINLISAGKQNG